MVEDKDLVTISIGTGYINDKAYKDLIKGTRKVVEKLENKTKMGLDIEATTRKIVTWTLKNRRELANVEELKALYVYK